MSSEEDLGRISSEKTTLYLAGSRRGSGRANWIWRDVGWLARHRQKPKHRHRASEEVRDRRSGNGCITQCRRKDFWVLSSLALSTTSENQRSRYTIDMRACVNTAVLWADHDKLRSQVLRLSIVWFSRSASCSAEVGTHGGKP